MEAPLVILSEIALALYPILIKTVPTNLETQVISRFLTYTVLGLFFSNTADIADVFLKPDGFLYTCSLSLLNIVHIGSSYYAFQQLPAGTGMTLFYMYPIFTMMIAVLVLGEKATLFQALLIAVAFTGVYLVSLGSKQESKDPYNWKGILAGLFAAITETLIYFAVKGAPTKTPFHAVLRLYSVGLVALLGLFGSKIQLDASVWLPMTLFNTCIGFLGYCLRFYTIPRLPTFLFSLLTFIGVVASFGWGYLFVNEIPTSYSIAGSALITGAVALSKTLI